MFDDALLESQKSHSLGGRRLSLPVAIGLHAAVIGAFVGASAWFTGEAPEPVIPVLFPAASTAASPPPPGGEQAPHGDRGPRSHAVQTQTQPDLARVDDIGPVPVRESAAPADSEADSGGSGSRDGVIGGSGDRGGQPGDDEPPDSGQILPIGGDVRAPVLLQRVDPDYPESARRAHLEGMLILEAVITASGTVREVRILRPLNPLLDQAAVRAVRQWRYRPATLNGRAVPVYLTVTVRFGIGS